jgi:hypothetical protein
LRSVLQKTCTAWHTFAGKIVTNLMRTMSRHTYIYIYVMLIVTLSSMTACGEKSTSVAVSPEPWNIKSLPQEATEVNASVFTLNAWAEQGRFMVAGLCSSASEKWLKLWVELRFLDENGNPVPVMGHATAIVPTFSDAMPPYGRSSFMGYWALAGFGKKAPKSCEVVSIKGVPQAEGPILVATNVSGLKMGVNVGAKMGEPLEEIAWQMQGELQNPLDMTASKPEIEVFVYGTDEKLWYCTLVDPATPEGQAVFNFIGKDGPLAPKESRYFQLRVFYENLPQVLKDIKIGRIDLAPFEGR